MMREEVPGKQFGTSSQSRLVPAEVDLFPDPQQEGFLDADNVAQIKKAIEEGKNLPPIVARENGQIIEGHHRAEAYKQLGKRPERITVSDAEFERMQSEGMTRDEIEYEVQDLWRNAARRAIETPQPATPAPSAAGKPVTAATLMEEAARRATQVNDPNSNWNTPTGRETAFKKYLKESGFDQIPDRPEFDPTNPKAQGKFGGSAKTQVNMDAKANRFVEYLKANKLEPTPDNVARATQTLNEADHPSAHTLEKIYTQMGYDALDVEELLARSMPKVESPAASAAPKQTTVGDLMGKVKK
jgi:hypothetical protein